MTKVKTISKPISVAIDGPAGAGKSTVARQVADALGYTYIDTGAMYRALAWAVLNAGISPQNASAVCALAERLSVRLTLGSVFANDAEITEKIRTPEISNLTSPLSALPCVRTRMVALQQEMGRQGGVVMEGRDIGTVVLPNAEVKVFLTASQAERVRRRREELGARGITMSVAELGKDIAERDARDASRDVAPMVPASDAVQLVSDGLSVDEVVSRILGAVPGSGGVLMSEDLTPGNAYPPERYTRAYAITRVIVRLMVPLLGGITVIGAENIPETGPIILAPNHRAYMDPPYLSMVTKRQLHLMAKDQLFRIPLFGPYIKAMGAFPVKRGVPDRGAIRQAIAELKAGRVMGIFPEGTRADPGTLLPAEKGFALIAKQTGVPIVPIALEGTDKVLPKHGRLHRAHVTATIGKPMTAQEMLAAYPDQSKDALTIISEATMRAIAALMSGPIVLMEADEKEEKKPPRPNSGEPE